MTKKCRSVKSKTQKKTPLKNTPPSPTVSSSSDLTIALIVIIVILAFGWYLTFGQRSTPQTLITTEIISDSSPTQPALNQDNLAGTYTTTLPGADGERHLTLTLHSDGQATFSQSYPQSPLIQETSTWEIDPTTAQIKVNLPTPLLFNFTPADSSLTLTAYDQDVWGSQGLTLTLETTLDSYSWTWINSLLADGTLINAASDKLGLVFVSADTVEVKTDCNSGRAPYTLGKDNALKFGNILSNLMFCEGAQEGVFFQQLQKVVSYQVTADSLTLTTSSGDRLSFAGN
jgi:heat shock protein HslJ